MFKGFKTVAFNILASILPILEGTSMTDAMNEEWTSVYGAILAGINIWLRFKTSTPIFKD